MKNKNVLTVSKIPNISHTNSIDLKRLAQESGYDSIRFFIAPDRHISKDSVISEMVAFFNAKKSGKGITHKFTTSLEEAKRLNLTTKTKTT